MHRLHFCKTFIHVTLQSHHIQNAKSQNGGKFHACNTDPTSAMGVLCSCLRLIIKINLPCFLHSPGSGSCISPCIPMGIHSLKNCDFSQTCLVNKNKVLLHQCQWSCTALPLLDCGELQAGGEVHAGGVASSPVE